MVKDWRNIKESVEILKFDKEKDNQTIVVKFLSEGRIKEFDTKEFDSNVNDYVNKKAESVEFDVEFNGKQMLFSTGSNRLIIALQNVADDLVNKRVKMIKEGKAFDTRYSVELMKK